MGNVWLDASLWTLISVVVSVLLVAAIGFLYPPNIGRHWVTALGATTLVNMAPCLAVGRRRRTLVVAMMVGSSATAVALLWYVVAKFYGMD